MKQELPIIQKTYDLLKWYVPTLNKLPREHKFLLGDRMISGLYDLMEGLILARYSADKLPQLKALNGRLDLLRHQTRLLLDFELMSTKCLTTTRLPVGDPQQQYRFSGGVRFGEHSSRGESWWMGIHREASEESRPVPVMLVTASEYQTGLG